MPKTKIIVAKEDYAAGVEVTIEIDVYPSADSRKEARRVIRRAAEEALLHLGEEVDLT